MATRHRAAASRAAFAVAAVASLGLNACGSSGAVAGSSSEFEDSSGVKYRITIMAEDPKPLASPGGCYPAPPAGRTSQQFTVTINNVTNGRTVAVPELFFGANLSDDATRVLDVTNVENAYGLVEAFSDVASTNCALPFDFAPRGATIQPNSSLTVVVTVAAIADPPPAGLALLTRVFLPDGSAHDVVTLE
jgi:hypothetical protein